jgi:hypothetical protein
MVKPRMAAVWHCHVVDGYLDPVFDGVRSTYSGPATLCQDLTVFNITPKAVIARQAQVSAVEPAVVGPSETERVVGKPPDPPAWWADASIDWQKKLS